MYNSVDKSKWQLDSFSIKEVLAHQLKAGGVYFRDICIFVYYSMLVDEVFLAERPCDLGFQSETVFSVWIVRIEIFVILDS